MSLFRRFILLWCVTGMAACGNDGTPATPVTPSTGTSTTAPPTTQTPSLETISIVQPLVSPGYPGIKSTQQLRVKAADAAGNALAGVKLVITGDDSAGWFYPSVTTTAGDGSASFVWVPGSPGAGTVSITGTLNAATKTVKTNTVSVNPPSAPLSALNLFLNNSGDASGYAIDLTPLTDPRGTYYAALVWNGGYAGLQRDGSLFHDQLQFSVWDASGGVARVISRGAGLSCVAFGGEGTGQACSMNFPWTVNRTYRFEMESLTVANGREISLYVSDVASSSRTFVGTLFSATTGQFTYLNTFVEQFYRVAPNCLEQPLREYVFTRAQARLGGSWQALASANVARQEEPTTICSNVDAYVAADGVHVKIGQRTAAEPKASQTISPLP